MSKISFSFLRNKFFLAGLLTGVVITALVFILIISSNYPPPSNTTLKGTVSGGWFPSVGSTGVVATSGNYCGYIYNDVVFDDDPNHGTFRCHSTALCSPGVPVECYSSNTGDFCQGGGPGVGIIPVQN